MDDDTEWIQHMIFWKSRTKHAYLNSLQFLNFYISYLYFCMSHAGHLEQGV